MRLSKYFHLNLSIFGLKFKLAWVIMMMIGEGFEGGDTMYYALINRSYIYNSNDILTMI